ncbi:MAG: hypothetical protein V2I36_18080 [Desulfopila sp.]|jgi:epoxyqueuosine reductase|nr:hypothetical protein [Desulfopila sp.]
MSTIAYDQLVEELMSEAEQWKDIRAGIADLDAVLGGPSCRQGEKVNWTDDHAEDSVQWLPQAKSLLVLAMHHPENEPQLDWFERGNTAGNRRLTDISKTLASWLLQTYGVRSQPLPYYVERGGVYLKDAAVYAGLGVIGKNNLLLHPLWGPRVRLRALLIEDHLPPSAPLENFDPCFTCDVQGENACPAGALDCAQYRRQACMEQLERNRAHSSAGSKKDSTGSADVIIKWCRECEFACPAGEK